MNSTTSLSRRGRAACIGAGWLHYVVGFFAGTALGVGFDGLIDSSAGRRLESWPNFQYELERVAILGFGGSSLLGLWMGWGAYGPARDKAAGLDPLPSRTVRQLLESRRGPGRLVGDLLYARFSVLTGASPPYHIVLRVLAVLLPVSVIAFSIFAGRDSDFVVAGWLGAAMGMLLADCLLVDRIAGWRASGRMAPPPP